MITRLCSLSLCPKKLMWLPDYFVYFFIQNISDITIGYFLFMYSYLEIVHLPHSCILNCLMQDSNKCSRSQSFEDRGQVQPLTFILTRMPRFAGGWWGISKKQGSGEGSALLCIFLLMWKVIHLFSQTVSGGPTKSNWNHCRTNCLSNHYSIYFIVYREKMSP